MALLSNINSYWKFDASNSNDSVGSNNGTDTGITYSSGNGKISSGAGFNGTTSKILFASTSSGTTAFSLSCWIKTSTNSTVIFGKRDNNLTGIMFCQTDASGFPIFYDYDGGAFHFNALTKATNVCDGSWHHIVVAIASGHASGTVYVDGVAGTAQTPTGLSWNTQVLQLGHQLTGTDFLNGALDEVGVWDRELTSTEITTLYNGGAGLQYPFTVANTSNFFAFM